MDRRNMVRDAAMLLIAGAIGWWAHGANAPVRAAGAGSDTARDGGGFGFQFVGSGPEASLTLYNPESKTLYVYPAAIGNAHINCAFSIHIEKPGAPLDRQNCSIGSLFSH